MRRLRRRTVALAAALLVAGSVVAAVTITYFTNSTVTPTLKAPPVVWAAGADSAGNNYVSSFTLSSNATYFTITLRPIPEVQVVWGNLTTLTNTDSAAHTVTVTGTSLSSNAKVLTASVEFYTFGNALVATLNLKDASPSASLGSVSASTGYYTKWTVRLDTATAQGDLPATVTLGLTVGA
ncbi:MAG: hypothetical protein ACT4PT_12085 [Methanobacteriota archaeon]